MAQGAVALPLQIDLHTPELSADEIREVQEYEKIVKFRDTVLAGNHPTVKLAAHLLGVSKQNNIAPIPDLSHISSDQARPHVNSKLGLAFEKHASQSIRNTPSGTFSPEASSVLIKPSGLTPNSASFQVPKSDSNGTHTRHAIDPILLEKSDDLIKAEIQLQRQRLERGLREQLEHQNAQKRLLLQAAESLPIFDIPKVLAQALERVPPLAVEAETSIGAASASDSFDENTFYSSQHESPMPHSPPQPQKDQADQSDAGAATAKLADTQRDRLGNSGDDTFMTGAIIDKLPLSQSLPNRYDTSQEANDGHVPQYAPILDSAIQADEGGVKASQPRFSPKPAKAMSSLSENTSGADHLSASRASWGATSQEPTHVRAHDLAPACPRPSRVSPLAVARDPPVLPLSTASIAPPAQITALHNEASGVSSTDSLPPDGKAPEKKKDKKRKKRNGSNRDNFGNAESTPIIQIKTEPRSVSPYEIPAFSRPTKRQRHVGSHAAELNYDEPRYDVERVSNHYFDSHPQESDHYARYGAAQLAHSSIARYDDEESNERRRDDRYMQRLHSPRDRDVNYQPIQRQPLRAESNAIPERRIYEEQRYYEDTIVPPRASVRSEGNRERSRSPIYRERSFMAMGPPRQPVQRIVVDAYGREYIDPGPSPSMRQSVVPRQREPELIYDRTPLRSVSGHVSADVIDEDGIVYRRASPAIAPPRRVITHPEYIQPENRSYGPREYSVRPNGEEFVKIREVPDHRQVDRFEEVPGGYAARAPSVRPETMRYEVARDLAPRLSSIRPEPSLREYAASVRPEARREILPPPARELSVRPLEMTPRRGYFMEEGGIRRYEGAGPRSTELAFIEQPRQREASVLVYADNVRREVRGVYR